MLLAPWAKFMGHFFNMKFNFLGCIGTTRNLENQSQNPHWAICLPAIGLRVQPLQEIWSDFAKFACVTKMLLVHSNMDGFQILKILLVAFIRAYHMRQWKNLLFQWNYGNKYPFSPKTAWKNGITFFQTQIWPPLRRLPPGFYSSKESWNPKFSRGMVKSGGIWRNRGFLQLWSCMVWIFLKKIVANEA